MNIHYSKDHITFFARYRTPDEHCHFAKHLIFGIDSDFECTIEGNSFCCKGICIGSGVPHTAVTKKTKMLVMLIEETSELSVILDKLYLDSKAYCVLEDTLINNIVSLCRSYSDINKLDREVLSVCTGRIDAAPIYDERISDVLKAITEAESIGEDTMEYLCRIASLSQSPLSHLFHEQVKISLASYLVNAKLQKVYEYMMRGEKLTTAVVHAGFNSSSHYAATCRRIFGISFSDFKKNS